MFYCMFYFTCDRSFTAMMPFGTETIDEDIRFWDQGHSGNSTLRAYSTSVIEIRVASFHTDFSCSFHACPCIHLTLLNEC